MWLTLDDDEESGGRFSLFFNSSGHKFIDFTTPAPVLGNGPENEGKTSSANSITAGVECTTAVPESNRVIVGFEMQLHFNPRSHTKTRVGRHLHNSPQDIHAVSRDREQP